MKAYAGDDSDGVVHNRCLAYGEVDGRSDAGDKGLGHSVVAEIQNHRAWYSLSPVRLCRNMHRIRKPTMHLLLLWVNGLAILARRCENGLLLLPLMRTLMYHHWWRAARAWISTGWLRRCPMHGIGGTGIDHLGIIRNGHRLRHVTAIRVLMNHHGSQMSAW